MPAHAEAGPLSGTLWPPLISVSEAPGSYFFCACAPGIDSARAIAAAATCLRSSFFIPIPRSCLSPALEAGLADQPGPLSCFVVDELAEFGRGARAHFEALGRQLVLDRRLGHRAQDFGLQLVEDRPRRRRRRHEAVPAGRGHVGKTLLAQGRRLRVERAAFGG